MSYTISVFYIGTFPDYADISASFVSTPVPEPASIVLVALGVALVASLCRQRRKRLAASAA